MSQPLKIYDLNYFDSQEAAASSLQIFADEKHPLLLPESVLLEEVADRLTSEAREGRLTAKKVLYAYQLLRENHTRTDAFCGWKDSSGAPCGGLMDIEVDAVGAYYKCKIDSSHRTPK